MAAVYCDDYPDLSHWQAVQEFTIEQAALLLAGIDPFDFNNDKLERIKTLKHPRWKLAHGYSLSLETAIRRGTLSPIICVGCFWNDFNQEWNIKKIDPNDRTQQMSYVNTIITRSSLNQWINNENVNLVRPSRPAKIAPPIAKENSVIHDSMIIKALPNYIHQSEGLELTQEIIEQFWATYDEENKQTAPTKEEIIKYLTGKGISKNLAEAVDLVLRPFNLRKVGRRQKG